MAVRQVLKPDQPGGRLLDMQRMNRVMAESHSAFSRYARRARKGIMSKEIRLNAFDMNCVVHQSAGLWRHPRDRSDQYARLDYWIELAKVLERGKFDGLFI